MVVIVLAGYWMLSPLLVDDSYNQTTVVSQNTKVVTSSLAATDNKTITNTGYQENMETYTNSIGMEFVLIPSGEFEMGSDDRYPGEMPVHEVTIKNAYYLGKYEVTQEQWVEIMGDNPSKFEGDSNPVECVSWDDVQEFVKKLNAKEGTDKYRLPTEAEWEYACRAGTATTYSFGDDESKLSDYVWYYENAGSKTTHPVGQKNPNPWGLYDMHGNVWEWCQDRWHHSYNGAPTDGSAWEADGTSSRVIRGGSWNRLVGSCYRYGYVQDSSINDLGFRIVREV
ncbi:formylglycine-generating enzyme family protein [Methanomethylovorans hollandica]|nr:formylglycine-generating enzyme family protein [Methanomethylovorans hollandica]